LADKLPPHWLRTVCGVKLRRLGNDVSGGTLLGVLASIRQRLARFALPGEIAAQRLGDALWSQNAMGAAMKDLSRRTIGDVLAQSLALAAMLVVAAMVFYVR
jgi:hypothetical protein